MADTARHETDESAGTSGPGSDTGAPLRKPEEAQMDIPDRTPGDGTLPGSVPTGLTAEELEKRSESDDQTSEAPGTS